MERTAEQTHPPAEGTDLRRRAVIHTVSRFGILVAWGAIILVFSVLLPDTFFTLANFRTIFGSQAILLILSLALIIPLTAGEFDLSVAGTMGLSYVLVGYLGVELQWPLALAIMAAFCAAIVVGLVNAFVVVTIGVESIVVTLGMGTLLTGVTFGLTTAPIPGIPDILVKAATHQFLGMPLAFFYGVLITAAVWYVFSHTPLGRYLYFVGAGREVARLSGIRVDAVRAGSLVAAAGVSGIAGIILSGSLGSSAPTVAASYLLPAFAAVFLGATAITPGRFNPWGTFIAVYFLITGITGLELKGLVGWVEDVFYGGSLIVAVALSRLAARYATR